ncbi:MAG: hypothetical protein OEW30_12425 [Acidimicrobiia bacterium]|nr:hypothetical protein [Acidimicrobiia bacterium]
MTGMLVVTAAVVMCGVPGMPLDLLRGCVAIDRLRRHIMVACVRHRKTPAVRDATHRTPSSQLEGQVVSGRNLVMLIALESSPSRHW